MYVIVNRRLVGVLLLLTLVSTSAVTAASLGSLGGAVQVVDRQNGAVNPDSGYGTLFLQVLLETRLKFFGHLPSIYSPIAGEAVSVSRSDAPDSPPLVRFTNSSGLVEYRLPVSDGYQVRINDSRFQTTFPVRVAGGVTSLIVTARRLVYQVSFEELSDSQSAGWTMAPQNDYLAIDTRGAQANLTGIVFLEIERNSSGPRAATSLSAGPAVDQVRLVILSAISAGDSSFLKVAPLKGIKVGGILRMLVVSYVPTVEPEL